ncbi:hypothetical protein WR25_02169 [Diploscapter pachys]|uniref:G-protein coupled receptors family 1 profile domain-containing protein n=1 Tax=Diploscapter pachys TaxID=2018661 RepID=A0A2A2KQP8_9BILA|nr:hypothetical protein WR25_02169 [Diploscapter pachys]
MALHNDSISNLSSIMNNPEPVPKCATYEIYTLGRFLMIVIATISASLGTIGNIFLSYIFCSAKFSNTPPTLYPLILAILDFAICFEYILLFGIDALVGYLKIESLFILYHLYIIPVYVLGRITQLGIPYMLIFATLERLVWTYGKMRNKFLKAIYSNKGRYITVIITLIVCVLLRIPSTFATEVKYFELCEDFFRTMTTDAKKWAQNSYIYYVFDFQIMTIAQTMIPFLLLIILNMIIVKKLKTNTQFKEDELFASSPAPGSDSPKSALNISFHPLKSMSSSVRSAVYTMAAIVTSYLASNTLHLILTFLERTDDPILRDPDDSEKFSAFHTFFSDTVSFVYMFTSAIRPLIYYLCNPVIRREINQRTLGPVALRKFRRHLAHLQARFPPPYCPPGTVCYPLYPPCPVPGSVGGPYALRGTKLDDRAKAIEIPDEMELRAAAFGVQLDKRSHKSAVFEALHKLGDLKEQENQSVNSGNTNTKNLEVEVPDKIVFISQAADQLTSGEIHKISQNSRKDSNGVSFSYQTDEVKSQTVQVPKKPKKTEDQDLSVSYPIGLGEVKKIHRKKKKESRDMVSGISRQVITPEIRRAPRDLKEDKTTEAPVQVTTVKDEESKSLDDNKCNSQVLKKLMMDLMNESSSESKKKINSAAEERFGGNVDVVCSRGHFR